MKILLFVHNHPLEGKLYGGSTGTGKAYNALVKKYNVVCYFTGKQSNRLLTLLRNIFLFSGGLSLSDISKIASVIKQNNIDIVYLDTSLLGRISKYIKRHFPTIKIIVNYHNCEAKYFYDLTRQCGVLYIPLWISAWYNERLSVKYADLSIFITEEDKKAVSARQVPSIIIPVTLHDAYSPVVSFPPHYDFYILFIGSAFYANIASANYLIKMIAPYISCNIIITGNGMLEALKAVKTPGNVKIIDYVSDLSPLYNNACAFIAPVFSGSGMKVKIAEAMMYGKKILATSHAFTGYKTNKTCIVCNTATDFISAIKNLNPEKTYFEESRRLFLENYDSALNCAYYQQIEQFFS